MVGNGCIYRSKPKTLSSFKVVFSPAKYDWNQALALLNYYYYYCMKFLKEEKEDTARSPWKKFNNNNNNNHYDDDGTLHNRDHWRRN